MTIDLARAFAIGVSPLDLAEWFVIGGDLARYLAEKRRLEAEHGDRVFMAEAETDDAQREVLDLVASHLVEHHPTFYSGDGNAVTVLSTGGSVDLGASALNTAETLRVEWEPELNRFNFQRGSNAKQSVTYEVGDSQPPFQLFRQIGTRTEVASCFSSARRSVSVSAKFDNFAVNNSAAP